MQQPLRRENIADLGARERMAVRQEFVLDAKISGFRAPQIADLWNKRCEKNQQLELQVTTETIRSDVRDILHRIAERESFKAEQLRELLTMRYESALVAIAGQLRNGNLRAVEVMIKLNKAIAEIHGLAAVASIDNSTTNVVLMSPEQRASRITELLSQAAERAMLQSEHLIEVSHAEEP